MITHVGLHGGSESYGQLNGSKCMLALASTRTTTHKGGGLGLT